MSTNNKSISNYNGNMELYYKGNGFAILKHLNSFYISWQEGFFSETMCYKISKENVTKAMKSNQDSYEVMIYAETGMWPLTEDKLKENTKEFIRNNPILLLKVPKNKELFSEDELEVLLKKAKDLKNKKRSNKNGNI